MSSTSLKLFLFLFAFAFLISSCKKYDEEVVPNNIAPPDQTITTTTIENYVNKSYISLLGREPDSIEYATGISTLKQNNLSSANRTTFLNQVLSKPDYYSHLFDINNSELLNTLDTNEITQKLAIFQFLLTDSTYYVAWGYLQTEIDRLLIMQQAYPQLQNGTSAIVDLHRTLVNNYFYDQINMGSLNFVVSLYQNFLRRYPTQNELNSGIDMVDGKNAIVFQQTGKSKTDFINIFFSTNDYYEGQVRNLYLRYLFREPTSTESASLTIQYKTSHDYKQLQRALLTTNEFIGI